MKRILTIIALLLIIFTVSCQSSLIVDTTNIPETVTVVETVTVEDTAKINELEKQLADSKKETEQYQNLIANLNDLLSNVYYGYASNSKWTLDGFTAFSIEYMGKYYIITAGHCVENEYGKFDNFKFKANFSNEWVYPELLTYENDFNSNRDYAIFYSDKVTSGLDFDLENNYPRFILGNKDNNIFKEFNRYTLTEGESGSPVIDLDGEVIGIATGDFTDIDLVLEVIVNLK